MTPTELYNHLIGVLVDTKDHTIVRHLNPAGALCYRIRDAKINPIANMPDSIFKKLQENLLLTAKNEREWQLNRQQLNLMQKKSSTSAR